MMPMRTMIRLSADKKAVVSTAVDLDDTLRSRSDKLFDCRKVDAKQQRHHRPGQTMYGHAYKQDAQSSTYFSSKAPHEGGCHGDEAKPRIDTRAK